MSTATLSDSSATYTIAEAAALTGLHKNTIRMRVKIGQLEAQVRNGKFGVEYRISPAALVCAGLIEGTLDPSDSPLGDFDTDTEMDEEPDLRPVAGEPDATPPAPAIAASLAELFQRHEQAMFRLGFMQSEMDRLKALSESAESLRHDQASRDAEAERLRRQLAEAREQAREAEALRRELEQARGRLRDAEDLRRLFSEMEEEAGRLRAAVEAAQNRPSFWQRLGFGKAGPV